MLLAGCHFSGRWEVTEGDPNCLLAEGDVLGLVSDEERQDTWQMNFLSISAPPATCTEMDQGGWHCGAQTSYDLTQLGADARGGSQLDLRLERVGRHLEGAVSLDHACSGQDCDALDALEPCGDGGTAPLRLERER